ncbi:MAG: CvpA family protein [Xanthomonadales bacterium]|nr:CvpA family protein [Xanthomonadales bacterium]
MIWVDYIIVAVIIVSVVISLFRGLIREVTALAIWLAAFWVAFQFADDGARMLGDGFGVPSARLAIAFAVLFLVTLLLGAIAGLAVDKLVETTGLTGTDRFLGMFFGMLRALVMVTAIVMVAGLTPFPRDPWWQESVLIPRFQILAEWAETYMPPEVRSYLDFGASGSEPSTS